MWPCKLKLDEIKTSWVQQNHVVPLKMVYVQNVLIIFSTTIGPHIYGSWNITKHMKIEKLMQCPSIKSPPVWYCNVFFLKRRYDYAFIATQM